MKVFFDTLKRTIENGSYAATCSDTSIIDNYHARGRLTDKEHDDLVAYWHEKNTPAPDPEPAPEDEEPADGAVAP